jgi:hypothetical protein
MSISNFIPQIWSTKILRTLEDNLVGKRICTLDAEGEIKKFGDSVIFNGLADPTIRAYSGSNITYEALQDASVVLQINQQDYFAFKVGDIEKAQANVDVKGSQADRAAYKLQQAADSYIMGLHGQAGLVSSATVNSINIFSKIGEIQQSLAQVNVSDSDMWMVIPPWVRLKLELAGVKFQINNGTNGTGGMAWTDALGFDIYVTNQVVTANPTTTPVSKVMAGSYNSIAFASQIMETENVRLIDTFDSAIRGLHVYGAKVIQPNLLHTATFTYALDTEI